MKLSWKAFEADIFYFQDSKGFFKKRDKKAFKKFSKNKNRSIYKTVKTRNSNRSVFFVGLKFKVQTEPVYFPDNNSKSFISLKNIFLKCFTNVTFCVRQFPIQKPLFIHKENHIMMHERWNIQICIIKCLYDFWNCTSSFDFLPFRWFALTSLKKKKYGQEYKRRSRFPSHAIKFY